MMTLAFLAGAGIQSALEPAGAQSESIANLWNFFLAVCAIVYVLVMIALVYALVHKGRASLEESESRTPVTVVSIATGISVLLLFALLISSIVTDRRAIAGVPHNATQVIVTGRQWWWQVEYDYADKSKRIVSANEINIPVGVPVHVLVRSRDVIHSFWVPNISGKQDLIPGRDNHAVLKATRPGVYRGECAEFCGLQHAKMALWVNAMSPADYAAWEKEARQPARLAATPQQRKGQEVFMSSPCPLCHNIGGTNAAGRTAPDLTHFASRRSIAAGTLPNRRGYLAGWIIDPQHFKPGTQMPPMLLHSGELEPLLDYLESLQ
ncbi:MAG: cytochrome c oxidase subunit II [Acidobacteriota bacterium]|nr:cytochrome c oxidase subunit II [Acidobacteriota bacterium]